MTVRFLIETIIPTSRTMKSDCCAPFAAALSAIVFIFWTSSGDNAMFRDCKRWSACAENLRPAPDVTPCCVRTSRKDGPVVEVGGICTGMPCGRIGAVLGGMILIDSGIFGSISAAGTRTRTSAWNDRRDLARLEELYASVRSCDHLTVAARQCELRFTIDNLNARDDSRLRARIAGSVRRIDCHREPDQASRLRDRKLTLETLERVCHGNLRLQRLELCELGDGLRRVHRIEWILILKLSRQQREKSRRTQTLTGTGLCRRGV